MESYKVQNEDLRQQLMYYSQGGGKSQSETVDMTIFPQEKPMANFDLMKLREGKTMESYVKKLEETVNYLSGKVKKAKKELQSLKDLNS